MTYLIIVVTILLVFDILRARKKEVPAKQWHSYEENMKAYNRFAGLPENSVLGNDNE